METQIKSLIITQQKAKLLHLFGYSSQGLPGLEIIIPGINTKFIKEKMIFITRVRKLPVPLKRYVICVDAKIDPKENNNWEFLELPLLLLFWSLANVIPVTNLSNCFCIGRISADGKIQTLEFDQHFYDHLHITRKLNCINDLRTKMCLDFFIPVQELLASIADLTFINPRKVSDYIGSSNQFLPMHL